MAQNSPVATDVTSMFDDLAEVAQRMRDRAEAELEQTESLESSDRPDTGPPAALVGGAARAARADALTAGARGLEKLADDPDAELTGAEEFGVEAIVLLVGRPALLVQSGDLPANLPSEWVHLDEHRAMIKESIARVGRIEVSGHPDLDWVGTGFLVAPDLVMTNRHVAREFAKRDGDGWSFLSGRSSSWDLVKEMGSLDGTPFTVTEVVAIHDADDVDLALLRVDAAGAGPLPSPLKLTAVAPDDVVGRPVYVVGYPAWDGRRNEPEPMRRIFMDVYNVKRFQPGVLTASTQPQTVLRHDCSTLGGNSGSPVFDLNTHQVIGLHFGGRYRVGNFAVPLWRLVDDPVVAAAAINYVD